MPRELVYVCLVDRGRASAAPLCAPHQPPRDAMDVINSVREPMVDFAKESARLVKKCSKPDRKGACRAGCLLLRRAARAPRRPAPSGAPQGRRRGRVLACLGSGKLGVAWK